MAKPNHMWSITDHVCVSCFGRILEREDAEKSTTVYRCADCGATATGTTPKVICTCGFKVRGRQLGLRCEQNIQRSPEFPTEIVARQA